MKTFIQPFRQKAFDASDLEENLKIAEVYGSLLHTVDIGQYDDPELEQALINKAEAQLPSLAPDVPVKDCLHVISEAYIIGGHTRLMEKLAAMHPASPDLLITRKADDKALTRAKTLFSQVHVLSADNLVDKVTEIRQWVAQYQRIVLHIHCDDIAAVVACGLVRKRQQTQVYFVNHADHAFTFGSSIADYYFQLSSYGARLDLNKTIAGRSSFLGIPVADIRAEHAAYHAEPLNFFSAGSAIKFKPFRGHDMRPLIKLILNTWKNASFTLVGINPITNLWWWPLKIRYGKRIKILRYLPYEQYLALAKEADFYVDSYPFPGGTAFAEQVLAGKRGIGLISRIQGYSPADKLKRKSIEEVLHTISHYDDQGVVEEIIDVNGFEGVKARYLGCLYESQPSTLNMENLVPWEGDTTCLQVRNTVFTPVSPVVMNYLYRNDRKLFMRLFLRMSVFNKAFIVWNALKA
ncbi:group 1 glycosyl transferase [Rouxiella badensis]|uniref:group 1 glycosyl transferase n=1 Tax=Rouxiella badensis TaxID=1646377 RepID=UPI001B5A420F|nr:group 1 glycosyl transferase [Rouxiella badensis]MCC3703430.1 group 1 glycosyl transferase [Rouxiella badensis]MCC3718369.1 group 1 glycosyl transferase [Rouxiella badensis]MCC3726863.1 group 1 glycosyl transferase [Rouxiella badensis]MCC3731853.1 group 1 glycosyl transferase [Rouxiella badensis]MCC3738788.1 group 1 glycosyl transferase [Rouxiella badensis]